MNDAVTEMPDWELFDDADEVAEAACLRILVTARQAIAEGDDFRLVLAGGSTPRQVYTRLAGAEADWAHWQIYFGDERCLPADHPDRNSVMATGAWLGQVPIPAANVHVIPAELGAEQGARAYRELMDRTPSFDLVLLGLGEDGHTASLFPGQEHPWDQSVVAVHDAPKPPPDRVSLGIGRLLDSRQLLFLVTGRGKADAVRAWRQGKNLPVTRISAQRSVSVFLDRLAEPG